MPSVDFDAARRARLADFDPVEFTLGGEHFVARPAIPFSTIAAHLEDTTRYTDLQAYRLAVGYIRDCLHDDDHDRLDRALANRDEPVDKQEPLAVLAYLLGCYVNRPTSPSSDSSDGRPTTGRPSNSKRSATSGSKASGKRQPGSSSAGSRVA